MTPSDSELEAELVAAAERAKERRAALSEPEGPETFAETVKSKRAPRRGDLASFFGPGMLPRGMTLPTPGAAPTCSRCGKDPCERNDLEVAAGIRRIRYSAFCANCRDLEFSVSWAKRMADAKKIVDPNARAIEVGKLENQRRAWTAKGRKCFT